MKIHKLDESYSILEGDKSDLNRVYNFLKIERKDAHFDPLVQRGFRSPFDYFAEFDTTKTVLKVYNGHLHLLKNLFPSLEIPTYKTKYTKSDIREYFDSVKDILPFKPYDYQLKAFAESIANVRQLNKLCTSSGKSMTISLICDFYRTKGLRGLLLVPNINLLNQFKSDIESYNLKDLYEGTETLGGGSECTFEKPLLISTWQSMIKNKDKLDNYDYLICDEVHRESSEVSSDIIKSLVHTKIKLGFTGTLPEDKSASMYLLGLFGEVHTYITARELIERGLGTPIKINTVFIKHPASVITEIRSTENYAKQLKVIEENQRRNNVICDLAIKLSSAKQNTLVLFSHTNHGKELFINIMNKLYPDVEVQNKDITGKKSFEFQTKYKVFFINGEDDGKTRELTRKVLEEYDDAILVSNFQLLSTGVNIRRLYNLIFAGSLKSYNTITQSLGRGMRLYKDKKEFKVFDIVDLCYNSRRPYTGVFYKQYKHRVETSYNPEGYPIKEIELDLTVQQMW
jgi:superfamily II DNA or RNA helicase